MAHASVKLDSRRRLQELLGYLNFSAGATDKRFLANLNELFGEIESSDEAAGERLASWRAARLRLDEELADLAQRSPAFRNAEQARAVIAIVFDRLLPAYREFHRDLLLHQSDADLFRPLFVGRAFEAALREGGPWDEPERIVAGALGRLNDYVGYRPVAVLHSGQRMEPYRHEWTRPMPLYVQGAGVAVGRYQRLISAAIELLRGVGPQFAQAAQFDLEMLDELALDLRAYDFDHPANKRPNHHFGQWDPNLIDNRGYYRRFVLQQVTLDALQSRITEPGPAPAEERLFEAAAVLAGVILMSSAVCGAGPGFYDSGVSLATLLPRVAANRDAFYEQLLGGLEGARGERLRAEARAGRQPLAGARQHLNHALVRRRATQLEQVHLALLYARMGHREAALRQAADVSVASARMRCEVQCRITAGELAAAAGRLDEAARLLVEAEDYLKRAIECGAMIDPWNILGFQAQFSLFPAPENSVHDHRADQLVELSLALFGLYARVWSEAAAADNPQVVAQVSAGMGQLASWWDPFATTTVHSLESFSGSEAERSAEQVAAALGAWRRGGAATGDIAFWRKHVEHFQSAKAYGLVVEALLEKRDLVGARALLVQWSSQAGQTPLKFGVHSFHALAIRWMTTALGTGRGDAKSAAAGQSASLVASFFDHLEANAEHYWAAPRLEVGGDDLHQAPEAPGSAAEEPSEEEDAGLFSAAYDEMVYVDSTDDGVEADMLETPGGETDFELEHESRRIEERLEFLSTVAALWKRAALSSARDGDRKDGAAPTIAPETLRHWQDQAERFEADLTRLLDAVERLRVPTPSASRESLLEFERRRTLKEGLLETIVSSIVAMSDCRRWLLASQGPEPESPRERKSRAGSKRGRAPSQAPADNPGPPGDAWLFRALARGDAASARRAWPAALEAIRRDGLLYVPLHKGGAARPIVAARKAQQRLRELLAGLPRLGMIRETCQLLEAAREIENDHPVGANAVTEFDRLFAVGYRSLVETLVEVSLKWPSARANQLADRDLVDCLERLTETLLKQWLAHSRTLRLSTLERIGSEREWQALVEFVERYGHDLLTQRFMNPANLRAILRQGVETWLARLTEDPPDDEELRLLDDLASGAISRSEAGRQIGIVLEAVLENFTEYRDYNSTTTQSDRGELAYTLLDFLRLRVQYDRVAWHLKPVLLAHEILVRNRRDEAAEMWRRALAQRTGEAADSLQARYEELRARYGMRLPTVADRLAERFVRPLAVDRLRALVRPAMQESLGSQPAVAFELLRQEADELTREPTGAGLDVPAWLQALEDEVAASSRLGAGDETPLIPQAPITLEAAQREILACDELL